MNNAHRTALVLLLLGCGLAAVRLPLSAALPTETSTRYRSAGVLVERRDGVLFLLVDAGTAPMAGKRWVTGREVASSGQKPDHFAETTLWIPIDEVRGLGEIATKERVAELTKRLQGSE